MGHRERGGRRVVRGMTVGEIPAGIGRKNLPGRGSASYMTYLKESRARRKQSQTWRRERSEKDGFGAPSDCEKQHNIKIKEQMMIAAQMIGDEK